MKRRTTGAARRRIPAKRTVHLLSSGKQRERESSISRKVLSVFTFPIFMFTYIPVSFAALFVKVEWKPIHHTVTAKELGRG